MTPPGYRKHIIDEVRRDQDSIAIVYDGRVFAGVMLELLEAYGITRAVKPGAEVFILSHGQDSEHPGQVAHIIMAHPDSGDWAELYRDQPS